MLTGSRTEKTCRLEVKGKDGMRERKKERHETKYSLERNRTQARPNGCGDEGGREEVAFKEGKPLEPQPRSK